MAVSAASSVSDAARAVGQVERGALRLAEGLLRRALQCEGRLQVSLPPPLRTKWTRRVPHPVLIGHAASFLPY